LGVPSLARWFCAVTVLSGCASHPYPDVDEPMPPPEPGRPAPAAAKRPSAITAFQRADVERVIDAGLGRFLTHVTLEPRLSAGRFAGWSIVALDPPDAWSGIDLRPGDVVTKVNGMAIEREMEAFDAFQAVRQASTLEVSYLRQDQARRLRIEIVGAPSPALPKAPPAPKSAAAKNP
jgi:S1-C subfamily serine protease